jgi:mRNA interferase MazF
VVISQGEVWWVDLPEPVGSAPGFRRPVVVVQGDELNRSRISTVLCVPLPSNNRWAEAPGNVFLPARQTGLPKDSVANVSQLAALDRAWALTERRAQTERLSSRRVLRKPGSENWAASSSDFSSPRRICASKAS